MLAFVLELLAMLLFYIFSFQSCIVVIAVSIAVLLLFSNANNAAEHMTENAKKTQKALKQISSST